MPINFHQVGVYVLDRGLSSESRIRKSETAALLVDPADRDRCESGIGGGGVPVGIRPHSW